MCIYCEINVQYEISRIICARIMTEVEALKRVVAEAEKKAAMERALREKHEAKVIKAK